MATGSAGILQILLFCSLLAFILLSHNTAFADNRIQGKVQLPYGETAPSGGLSLTLRAWDGAHKVTAELTIADGQGEVDFDLILPGEADSIWRLSYAYSGSAPYLSRGNYYAPATTLGTSWYYQTLLTGARDYSGIKMTLLPGNRISGQVRLPGTEVAPVGGMYVDVQVRDSYRGKVMAGKKVFIPAGESSAPYMIPMLPYQNIKWLVSYLYRGDQNYLSNGTYSIAGTDFDGGTMLLSGKHHSGINLTLLHGNELSGEIALPPGEIAPMDGLWVYVVANNMDWRADSRKRVFIPSGKSSAPYVLTVPKGTVDSGDFYIYYNYIGNEPYLPKAYYKSTGMTFVHDYDYLPLDRYHSNINLYLMKGVKIEGALSLPGGEVAPTEGIEVRLHATANNLNLADSYSDNIVVPAGNSSIAYDIVVPSAAEARLILSEVYEGELPYLNKAYYATSGTTWKMDAASFLSGGMGHSGVDLELLGGNRIRGNISLPLGDVAPLGGLSIRISASMGNGQYEDSINLVIPEGESQGSYIVAVPHESSTGPTLKYSAEYSNSIYLNEHNYLLTGYYSGSGTVEYLSQAEVLSGGVDYTGIDLILLRGIHIQGQVTLPDAEVAPLGGIWFEIRFEKKNGYDSGGGFVYIAEGSSTVSYSFAVSADPEAQWLAYYLFRDAHAFYLDKGFYNVSATVKDEAEASLLKGGIDHSSIDFQLLRGHRINGYLRLPSGRMAPPGGLFISIKGIGVNTNSSIEKVYFMSEGDSRIPYTFSIHDSPNQLWQVKYYYRGHADYLAFGWYSLHGTATAMEQASLLGGDRDHSGIDLELIAFFHLSGTVSLPIGQQAGVGGVEIYTDLSYVDNVGFDGEEEHIFIPEGKASAAFTMRVWPKPVSNMLISYWLYDEGPFLKKGYYRQEGTVPMKSSASLLPAGTDYQNISLRLLKRPLDDCSSSDAALLGPVVYSDSYYCKTEHSIEAGSIEGVIVGSGAYVVYSSPSIRLRPGFMVQGGIFRAGKALSP